MNRMQHITHALLFVLGLLALAEKALADANIQAEVEVLYQAMPELDDRFQQFSNAFYTAYVSRNNPPAWRDLQAVPGGENLAASSAWVPVMAGVRRNLAVVCANYTSNAFKTVMTALYQFNETATLRELSDCIKSEADPPAVADNYFQLAQYYYARKQWPGVLAALANVNRKDLPIRDAHYADLLQGYALQEQKKHRDAVKIYRLIPPSSPYYAHAQLNEGLGYLRQGWWSEAYDEFNQAIAHAQDDQLAEFKHRVLVVLGFSQLYHEFYRDARATLRQVSLDSRYTNRALMGLGLAAAYQQDYGGALNAFNRLRGEPTQDLSVDEAYLLVPNTYEELGDDARAANTYREAVAYYQQRIAALAAARVELSSRRDVDAPTLLATLDAQAEQLYGAKNLIPLYIVNNYHSLLAFKPYVTELKLNDRFTQLEVDYDRVLKDLVLKNIRLREAILQSYMSQAKYGVAKLYDKP